MLKLAQLSRKRGSKLPAGFRSIARPGPLGNPFRHADGEYAVKAFRYFARGAVFGERFGWQMIYPKNNQCFVHIGVRPGDPPQGIFQPFPDMPEAVIMVQKANLEKFKAAFLTLEECIGIACWCNLSHDTPCHGKEIVLLWEEYRQRMIRDEGVVGRASG